MAQVLSPPGSSDGSSHFGANSLHRSSSQTFVLQNPSSYSSSFHYKPKGSSTAYETRLSTSLPSSAPSSPRLAPPEFSNQPSYTSTPSSSLSLSDEARDEDEDEDITFPTYDDQNCLEEAVPLEPPPSPQPAKKALRPRAASASSPTISSSLDSSNTSPTAGDDTSIIQEPTRHVDYLSHDWKEEDIWSSWRHIVARRKVYTNSYRLENASWRTWAKAKYHLKTVSPDILNWYDGSSTT